MLSNKHIPVIFIQILLIGLIASGCKQESNKEPEIEEAMDNVLIKGSFFQGANGLYFDKNDRLHIASVVSRFIGIVDTSDGSIIDTLTIGNGVEGPDDLTFGADGTLYFTSILTGEVGKIGPDGATMKQFVAAGTNPITFSDDGRLFVALDFQGDGLYELDPNFQVPPKLIIKELGWLNAMDFGPDGYLYGPIWSKGQIVRIDVDKASIDILVDDLQTPAAVKFNSKGELYTIDHKTGTVYEVDIESGEKESIISGSEFIGADNLAFNSQDEMYITNAQDGSLYQVYQDGSKRVVIPPSVCNAADIEVVGDRIIIPDILSMKSINDQGNITHSWHHMIGVPGIIGPFTVDAEGNLLALTSWFSNEVQIWDISSDEAQATYHDYAVPINAIFDDNALVVAELGLAAGEAKVTRRTGEGKEVLIDASGGLIVPSGLACSNSNCYVADYYLGSIIQITRDGQLMDKREVVLDSLKQPEGLQIDSKGRLIIVETGANRVLAYDFDSKSTKVLVDNVKLGTTGPAGMPPTWKLSDVALDDSGNLYVPSDVDNVVYVFSDRL